ncbi:rhomboid family intramembrane serine protease [Polaribacter sp. R77954]|uniref:rhomboid family intramembrane serine protease n=1 Tax=Polaribacter sp. R77954 TaxID=3093870 RepID=UPI0037C85820
MSIIDDIKRRYITGNIIEKLILINIGIFIITVLAGLFQKPYAGNMNFIAEWFSLDDTLSGLFTKPWSIISYGFLHAGFIHILFNCIALYFIGNLFIQYFTEKQLLNFYVLGTFFGGVLYIFSQSFFPLFEGKNSYLVGASAGISAIFLGIATYMPNYELKFPLIGYVKLWQVTAVWILLDIIGLVGNNAGGSFAHLGGALFGFLYVNKASNKEIKWFDGLNALFTKKEKSPLKTVYKSKEKRKSNPDLNQQQVDKILDKISKSGYDTLSKAEKDFLFRQGKK